MYEIKNESVKTCEMRIMYIGLILTLEDPAKPLCKSVYELMTWNEAKLEGF